MREIRHSLRVKLLIASVLIELAMLTLLVANSTRLIEQHLVKQTLERLGEFDLTLNIALAAPMAARDYAYLQNIIDGWVNVEGIAYMVVTDRRGKVLASAGRDRDAPLPESDTALTDSTKLYGRAFPVRFAGQEFGELRYGVNTAFLREAKGDLLMQSLAIAAAEIMLSILLLGLIGHWLTRHLTRLTEASVKVAQGNFDTSIAVRTHDEVGLLAGSFNRMIEAVRQRIDALSDGERRFRAIADYTYSWENWFSPDGRLRWVNPAVERVTGYSPAECLRMADFPFPLIHPDDRAMIRQRHETALAGYTGRDVEFRILRKDEELVWVAMSWQPIFDEVERSLGFRSSIRDVTLQHQATEELAFQATHDPLTGLKNRRFFEDRLREAIAGCRNGGAPAAMLYIDLDQFKVINDSCGHAAGDVLLQRLAHLLQARAGENVLARLGGDEFGLLLADAGIDEAVRRAQRLIDEIRAATFSWDGHSFRLGTSVGIAPIDASLHNVNDVLAAADSACYAAKERGRNRVEVFVADDSYFINRREEFSSLAEIVDALEQRRLSLYLQTIRPLVRATSRVPDHAEVLVRLNGRDGRVISPASFIPAAERYNMMPYVDRWVVEELLRTLAAVRDAGRSVPWSKIAVNLSGTSLSEEGMAEFIVELLDHYRIDSRLLCFEITETAAIASFEKANHLVTALRGAGCSIALDDFGSGLSSFAYLKRLRVDYLKIDGMFIKALDSDATDAAVVESFVRVAHVHGLKTVAEFVHSDACTATNRLDTGEWLGPATQGGVSRLGPGCHRARCRQAQAAGAAAFGRA